MPPIINVENLSKKYTLHHERGGPRYRRLSEDLVELIKRPFRSRSTAAPAPSGAERSEEFWALRDVSFEIEQGEVVGIIGRNGAGKSTLLKILSRITEPTTGRVRIRGRVASLLEVGTGFHPELTGRENIFLNGAILAMSRSEIKRKFDEIVAFAEVEQFLDTPVKHFSSGMYVRLAFSVAAHLEPDILIVDEVLAVGDAEFQKKCLGKMQNVATQEGRTVLFVSHNMGATAQLCSRGLLIEAGAVRASAPVKDIIRLYARTVHASKAADISAHFRGPLSSKLNFTSLTIASSDDRRGTPFSPGDCIRLDLIGEASAQIPRFNTSIAIHCNGVRLLSMPDSRNGETIPAGCRFKSSFVLPCNLLRPDDYFVSVGGQSEANRDWIWATDVAHFSVLEEWSDTFASNSTGLINIEHRGTRTVLERQLESAGESI